jgi:hypothetical protein
MPSTSSSPLKKIILGLLLFIAIGAVTAFLFWNQIKYKFIKDKVRSAVFEKTNGLYTIRYDKMDLDETTGYLRVLNLDIIPDTAMFRRLIGEQKNPPVLLRLHIPAITVEGVATPAAMIDKSLKGRKLLIDRATILFYYAKHHPDTADAGTQKELYQQLLGNLKEIQADSIDIKHADISFVHMLSGHQTITANDFSIHLRDVWVDSLHSRDTTRFLFAKHFALSGDTGLVRDRNGLYHYRLGGLSFTTDDALFSVQSVSVEPLLGETAFAQRVGVQSDRFNLDFGGIRLKHLALQRLIRGDVVADSLLIARASIRVYRDLSYPRPNTTLVKKFPHQLISQLPLVLSVSKCIVRDGSIEYKEKNPKSGYAGRVQFAGASATISNITNERHRLQADPYCHLVFNAAFLGKIPLHAELALQIDAPDGHFRFSGGLQSFDGPVLNPLIEPMGLARIDKGIIHKTSFSFSGNNRGSNGRLTMLYDDLKLTLLKKNDDADSLQKKSLASFIANIIVKDANPTRSKPVRVADVQYQHDPNRSFFNLMWKSIFTGVKQTVGMGSKK